MEKACVVLLDIAELSLISVVQFALHSDQQCMSACFPSGLPTECVSVLFNFASLIGEE